VPEKSQGANHTQLVVTDFGWHGSKPTLRPAGAWPFSRQCYLATTYILRHLCFQPHGQGFAGSWVVKRTMQVCIYQGYDFLYLLRIQTFYWRNSFRQWQSAVAAGSVAAGPDVCGGGMTKHRFCKS